MVQAILLDDEENAVDILEVVLTETGEVKVMSKFTRPCLFLQEIYRLKMLDQLPEVVFIDIEMPEISGLEVAEQLKAMAGQIEVVFVTAYSEYAVKAFELFSLDYLLKPVCVKRMEKTLERLAILRSSADRQTLKQEVHIQCMGDFIVHYQRGKKRLRWRTEKVKELCAYLLHHAGRGVPTHELIEGLFPESDTEKAKVHFYTSMSYLRKAWKDIGYPDVIQKNSDGYMFHLEGLKWDYMEVEQVLVEIFCDHSPNWSAVERLMSYYRGDYFSIFEQNDFIGRREKLRRNVLEALHRAKETSRKEGNLHRITECLINIRQVAPESEMAAKELIELFVEQGNQAGALQCYRQIKQHLLDEYGIEPGFELTSCVERLLHY